MRKMKNSGLALIALAALCLSLAACTSKPDPWALAARSLGTPGTAAHPHLVTGAMVLESGWEVTRRGPWHVDQRLIPDFLPFGGAVVSVHERLGISNGRPRDHAYWTTYSHHGLPPR